MKLSLVGLYRHAVTLGGATAFFIGCSEGSFVPTIGDQSDRKGPAFFPLQIGNEWTYNTSFSVQIIPMDGSPIPPPDTVRATGIRTLIGRETLSGQDYIVEKHIVFTDTAPDTLEAWFRYRQDGSGLYVANVPINQPPTSAPRPAVHAPAHPLLRHGDETYVATLSALPPSVRSLLRGHLERQSGLRRHSSARGLANRRLLTGEFKLLAYPLRRDAWWIVRDNPLTLARVEAQDTVALGVGDLEAYRIRVESEFFGDEDFELWWYGPCGRLRTIVHQETLATDSTTGEIVRIITEEIEELVDVRVVDHAPCSAARPPVAR